MELFGWRADPYGALTLWRLPGYCGLPEQPVPRDTVAVMREAGGPAEWSVDFRVSDVDATATRALSLGGEVHEAPHDTGAFRTADLADPQGARFSITHFT